MLPSQPSAGLVEPKSGVDAFGGWSCSLAAFAGRVLCSRSRVDSTLPPRRLLQHRLRRTGGAITRRPAFCPRKLQPVGSERSPSLYPRPATSALPVPSLRSGTEPSAPPGKPRGQAAPVIVRSVIVPSATLDLFWRRSLITRAGTTGRMTEGTMTDLTMTGAACVSIAGGFPGGAEGSVPDLREGTGKAEVAVLGVAGDGERSEPTGCDSWAEGRAPVIAPPVSPEPMLEQPSWRKVLSTRERLQSTRPAKAAREQLQPPETHPLLTLVPPALRGLRREQGRSPQNRSLARRRAAAQKPKHLPWVTRTWVVQSQAIQTAPVPMLELGRAECRYAANHQPGLG